MKGEMHIAGFLLFGGLGRKVEKAKFQSVRLLALAARCNFGRVFYAVSSFS